MLSTDINTTATTYSWQF